MIRRLVQVLMLGLMLLIPLLLGCNEKAQAQEEPVVESVEHTVSVDPIVVQIVVECNHKDIVEEIIIEPAIEEIELLAHLIYAEAGSDWCSNKMQLYTGSVVLNRMKHEKYPDTMYDVIYQQGQYSCTWNGGIEKPYNQRAYNCARYLLENGSVLPDNVIFQAQFEQGDGTYEKVQNMYFCYKGE